MALDPRPEAWLETGPNRSAKVNGSPWGTGSAQDSEESQQPLATLAHEVSNHALLGFQAPQNENCVDF